MGKRSRSKNKRKLKQFHKPSQKVTSKTIPDSQAENLLSEGKHNEVIVYLENLAKNTILTDAQLSALAYAVLEEKGAEALEVVERINQPSPRDIRVKSWCYIYEKKWDEAIELLRSLIEKDDSVQVAYAFVVALKKGRDIYQLFDTEIYKSGISENPDINTTNKIKEILAGSISKKKAYPVFYVWLEDIWFCENNREITIESQNLSLLESGVSVFPWSELIIRKLTDRLWSVGKKEEALNLLIQKASEYRYSGRVYIDIISYLQDLGRPKEAIEYCEIANNNELFVGDGKDIFRASVFDEAEEYDEVISLLDKYLQSSDLDIRLGSNIFTAYAYAKKGDNENSLIYVNQAADTAFNIQTEKEYVGFDHFFDYKDAIDKLTMWAASSSNEALFLIDAFQHLYLDKPEKLNSNFLHLFGAVDYEASYKTTPVQYTSLYEAILNNESLKNKYSVWFRLYSIYISKQNYLEAFNVCLQHYIEQVQSDYLYIEFGTEQQSKENDELELWELIDNKKDASAIHKSAWKALKKATFEEREKVFLPVFQIFWSELLKKHKMFAEICTVAETLLVTFPENTDLLWKLAYYYHELKFNDKAKGFYQKLLEIEPENSSALHNLAVIFDSEYEFDEAIKLSDKAVQLRSDYELFQRVNKNIHNRADEFERAKTNWVDLDFYKKKILSIIYKTPYFPSSKYIAKEMGAKFSDKTIGGHIRRLKEQGWLTEENQLSGFVPRLLNLSNEQFELSNASYNSSDFKKEIKIHSESPKPKIIHLDNRNPIKRIFNSDGEYHYYQEFMTFFPGRFVIPNVSLQTIFKYDTMLQMLDSDTFNYYLKASVDICVITIPEYTPLFGFELDGKYHEDEKQQLRDERKNRIFINAGLPLIRVKYNGTLSREGIRSNIIEAMNEIPNRFGGLQGTGSTNQAHTFSSQENNSDEETVF